LLGTGGCSIAGAFDDRGVKVLAGDPDAAWRASIRFNSAAAKA
jgi:hypothetical protein